jgi:hypothetical protein
MGPVIRDINIWDLLERTDLARVIHTVIDEEHVDREAGEFDPLRDPHSTDLLAETLVASAKGNPQAVLVPEAIGAAVLGFGVAVRLGVPVLRLFEDEGLVGVAGELRPDLRVLVVSPLADDRLVELAESYLHATEGAAVIDAVALLGTPVSRMRALAHLASRRYPRHRCPVCAQAASTTPKA